MASVSSGSITAPWNRVVKTLKKLGAEPKRRTAHGTILYRFPNGRMVSIKDPFVKGPNNARIMGSKGASQLFGELEEVGVSVDLFIAALINEGGTVINPPEKIKTLAQRLKSYPGEIAWDMKETDLLGSLNDNKVEKEPVPILAPREAERVGPNIRRKPEDPSKLEAIGPWLLTRDVVELLIPEPFLEMGRELLHRMARRLGTLLGKNTGIGAKLRKDDLAARLKDPRTESPSAWIWVIHEDGAMAAAAAIQKAYESELRELLEPSEVSTDPTPPTSEPSTPVPPMPEPNNANDVQTTIANAVVTIANHHAVPLSFLGLTLDIIGILNRVAKKLDQ